MSFLRTKDNVTSLLAVYTLVQVISDVDGTCIFNHLEGEMDPGANQTSHRQFYHCLKYCTDDPGCWGASIQGNPQNVLQCKYSYTNPIPSSGSRKLVYDDADWSFHQVIHCHRGQANAPIPAPVTPATQPAWTPQPQTPSSGSVWSPAPAQPTGNPWLPPLNPVHSVVPSPASFTPHQAWQPSNAPASQLPNTPSQRINPASLKPWQPVTQPPNNPWQPITQPPNKPWQPITQSSLTDHRPSIIPNPSTPLPATWSGWNSPTPRTEKQWPAAGSPAFVSRDQDPRCYPRKSVNMQIYYGHIQIYVMEDECVIECQRHDACRAASFNDQIFPHRCIFAYDNLYQIQQVAGASIYVIPDSCPRGSTDPPPPPYPRPSQPAPIQATGKGSHLTCAINITSLSLLAILSVILNELSV